MARQAFEDAIAELDSVSEDSYKVPPRGAMGFGGSGMFVFVLVCDEIFIA